MGGLIVGLVLALLGGLAVFTPLEPPPAPAAQSAGGGNWLEPQLASITAWPTRMHEQIASAAADPELAAKGQPRASPARDVPR
ncbi:MAG TPA: hypothetical protein VEH31_26175 [Streptosporangiaceae bacterium]|nr:hypothetical protein [Streptosporangiaceae bacterium]HYA52042.1 hypothetical protein [Streptosporangiaceae bacterium]